MIKRIVTKSSEYHHVQSYNYVHPYHMIINIYEFHHFFLFSVTEVFIENLLTVHLSMHSIDKRTSILLHVGQKDYSLHSYYIDNKEGKLIVIMVALPKHHD